MTLILIVILGTLILIVRILNPPLALDRLSRCTVPCAWENIPSDDLAVGDVVAALGSPSGVLISGTNGSGYNETLIYPAQALTVLITNVSLIEHVLPITRENMRFETLRSDPVYALPWRGFALLCRYVPDLINVCAAP